MSEQRRRVAWSWQCTACGGTVPGRVRAVLRIPFSSLMDFARCKALCPHCAEIPPEPDEVEPVRRRRRDDD